MPLRKPVKRLQDLCVRNITENLHRHSLAFHDMCKERDRRNTSYKFLHRFYSAQMFEMLRDGTIIPDPVCPTVNECIAFNFQEETKAPENDYLQFILNHYTTNLNLSMDPNTTLLRKYFLRRIGEDFPKLEQMTYIPIERRPFSLTDTVLYTIANVAENLSVVELQQSGISSEDLTLILKSIPNVVDLKVSNTRFCDIHMEIVRRTCTMLTKLDISYTSVTDEGVECFCGDNSKVNEGMCKLSNLNIKATGITSRGTRMLLESLPNLENLQYFEYFGQTHVQYTMTHEVYLRIEDYDPNIPMTHIFGGVVKLFFDINKHTFSGNNALNVNKCNLQELYLGIRETEEDILKFASVCFPEVRSVHIAAQMPPQYLLLCTAFSRLTDITLYLLGIPLLELDELFTVHGSKIEVLSLKLNSSDIEEDEYMNIFSWLELCPKLREFSFDEAFLWNESVNDAKELKYLPTSLSKISLSGINGSGSRKFLIHLLSSATHVLDLSFYSPCQGADEAVREAHRIHGFKHLLYVNLNEEGFTVDTIYLLLRINNLRMIAHPFSRYNRIKDYEKMQKMVKEDNLDIKIMDSVW